MDVLEKNKKIGVDRRATSWSAYALECPHQPPHLGVLFHERLFVLGS